MSALCRFEPSLPCTGAFTLSIGDCVFVTQTSEVSYE